jgi:hypothetical protein
VLAGTTAIEVSGHRPTVGGGEPCHAIQNQDQSLMTTYSANNWIDGRFVSSSTRGTGIVGYNVQTAVDTEHHLIVAHEVTNVGSDRD